LAQFSWHFTSALEEPERPTNPFEKLTRKNELKISYSIKCDFEVVSIEERLLTPTITCLVWVFGIGVNGLIAAVMEKGHCVKLV